MYKADPLFIRRPSHLHCYLYANCYHLPAHLNAHTCLYLDSGEPGSHSASLPIMSIFKSTCIIRILSTVWPLISLEEMFPCLAPHLM